MQFNDNKAGMAGIDRERIQKIIDENTSPDFEGHARKRRERTDARIRRYKETMSKLTSHQIAQAEAEMDTLVSVLEKERDLSRFAVHVDMDAFFAAVEMRDDPSLRAIPMAVGTDSMLSTSNYVARRFGVRAAMPGFIAKKLCPELKIIRGCFEKYRKASAAAREIFKIYDPDFYMGSLDEAYMDLTNYVQNRLQSGPVEHERIRYMGECICRLPLIVENDLTQLGNAEITEEICTKCGKTRKSVRDHISFGVDIDEVVREMRFRVEQATGLTCSAGIAPNSMLAKVCSDINKPNGQFRVLNEKDAILTFMRDLPIRKISGIGPVTEAVLRGIGLEKCGDLYEQRGIISILFTQFNYEYFLRIALGISHVYSTDKTRRKSISTEKTFSPTGDLKILLEITESLCGELVDSLPDHKIRGGRTATVKMKYSTFDVITRCCSVDYVISDADRLFTLCSRFVRREMHNSDKHLRLLGVRLSRLIFEDEKVGPSKPLLSFWKPSKTDSQAAEHLREASNGGFPSSRDEIVDGADSRDGSADISSWISDEVICLGDLKSCPVCKAALPTEIDLANLHVDMCLNRHTPADLQNIRNSSTVIKKTQITTKKPKKRMVSKKISKKLNNQDSIEKYLIKIPRNL